MDGDASEGEDEDGDQPPVKKFKVDRYAGAIEGGTRPEVERAPDHGRLACELLTWPEKCVY